MTCNEGTFSENQYLVALLSSRFILSLISFAFFFFHLFFLTDFDWSITNDFILSASLDCTARVWDPASGQCVRVVNDSHSFGMTACRFQPLNNNMLLVSFCN